MKKFLNKKGFTLLEVIAAIAIVAILVGIAIPSIANSSRSLSSKQANDYAKSIYLAAQNNLASMRTDGSLLSVLKSLESASTVYTDKGELKDEVKAVLKDTLQTDLIEKDGNREYVFINGLSSDEAKILIPSGSIDSSILNKKIFIIFNKETGDVYFVKYGDKGEYNGTVVNKAESLVSDDIVTPEVYLFNGQEYLVKISVPVPEDYSNKSKAFYDALQFTVTVSDAGDSSKFFSFDFTPAETGGDFSFNYSSGVATWVLDSLRSSSGFADKSEGVIANGKDVTVKVDYYFDADAAGGKEVEFDSSRSEKTGNPLFASVKGKVISVSNGRNLSNLNKIDNSLAASFTSDTKAEVKLTGDIAWGDTVGYYQKIEPDFKRFTPLAAEKLFAAGSKLTFNGNNRSIINLYENLCEKPNSDAGLFSRLCVAVKDLTLTDPIIAGSGSCGALAGVSDNASITNCTVKITSESNITGAVSSGSEKPSASSEIYGVVSTGNSAGLLVGDAANKTVISKCAAVMDKVSIPASAENFGLLAGKLDSSEIKDGCTVEGSVLGGKATNVGLVAGYAKNAKYTGVNVSGSVENTFAYNIGYIAGAVDGGTVSNVSIDGAISNVSSANIGAVGVDNGGTYSNITVNSDLTNIDATNIGGLAGSSSNGTFSGETTVSGTMSQIKGGCVGGAFGSVVSGTVSGIKASVSMDISSAYDCSEIMTLSSGGSFDSTKFGSGTAYACPSGLGYVGKFVGFIESGSFSGCSAEGVGLGKYSGLQFVGVVKPNSFSFSASDEIWESTTRLTAKVDADQSSDGNYRQKDGTAVFYKAGKYVQYNDISLSNCTYKYSDNKTYKQEIASDKYYYTLSNSQKGTQLRFEEITGEYDYSSKTPFIILDDTRQYAFALNANYNPPVTLYTVSGLLDYFPTNTLTRAKSSTTPIYFFSDFNTNQTYEPVVLDGIYGMIYEKANHWPLRNTYIKEKQYNIFDTYFVLNDTSLVNTAYDHVVYDIQKTFDFGKNSKGEFNAMYTYNTRGGMATYWSGIPSGNNSDGSTKSFSVQQAYVYTDTVRYELSSVSVNLVNGESGADILIRDNTELKNALWQNVSDGEAGYNWLESEAKWGVVLLQNYAFPTITRTLGGQTATDPIYLTIADNEQYANERGTYMTAGMRFSRQDDILKQHITNWNSWKSDYNVRTVTIENKTDSNGKAYTTISRNWKSDNPFYLGMVDGTLYTKHASDISNPSFNHLHLYALQSSADGETYNIASFSPTDSPAKKITSSVVS